MDEQIEQYLFGGKRKTILKIAKQEYVFDKLIFYILVLILLTFTIIILYSNNMDKSQHIYLNCPEKYVKCFNPYYKSVLCGKELKQDSFLCTQEIIDAPYTYGTKPPSYVTNFGNLAGLLVIISLIINHLINNRHFKFKELKGELQDDK